MNHCGSIMNHSFGLFEIPHPLLPRLNDVVVRLPFTASVDLDSAEHFQFPQCLNDSATAQAARLRDGCERGIRVFVLALSPIEVRQHDLLIRRETIIKL